MNHDLRALDLNLLKTLDALLDERSVTRAAERLALTQPAVSAMLNRLREAFDDPLFTRSQRGIVPTLRALELAVPVRQILHDISQLLQPSVFAPASATLTFTLAATDYALRALVVPFMAALREQAPGIRVAVVPVSHDQIQGQLERGEVDAALMTPDTTPAELHARALYEERYVCLLRDDHPAAQQPLTLDLFCQLDQALVSYSGKPFRGVTDDALAALGRERRITLAVSTFMVLPEILRVSDLLAVVPARLARHLPGLKAMEPPLAIPGFIKNLAWHERTHRDEGQRWLRALLRETAEKQI